METLATSVTRFFLQKHAAHLYCGRPELEGLLASLLHYGIHTFGAKDGNWIEPGGRRWMVLPGYDEEVWNG